MHVCNGFTPMKSTLQNTHNPTSLNAALMTRDDYTIADSFNLIVLGDLHLEDNMEKHNEARNDCLNAITRLSIIPSPSDPFSDDNLTVHQLVEDIKDLGASQLSVHQLSILLENKIQGDKLKCHLVSLGDLGRKDIRHEPGDAGTSKSFRDAKQFLDGFGLDYDIITGNHDLEGLDEFATDQDNLNAWMTTFDKKTSYFMKYIGEKTLLLGLSTVRFRDAPHSSHECHVDQGQLDWFQKMVDDHPEEDGWRICVFSHAPIMGSNLRVLQNVHVING